MAGHQPIEEDPVISIWEQLLICKNAAPVSFVFLKEITNTDQALKLLVISILLSSVLAQEKSVIKVRALFNYRNLEGSSFKNICDVLIQISP